MTESTRDRLVKAAFDALNEQDFCEQRQANGVSTYVVLDGDFYLQPVIDAILSELEKPSDAVIERAFSDMNKLPSGFWRKASHCSPREKFEIKMRQRLTSMIAAIREGK